MPGQRNSSDFAGVRREKSSQAPAQHGITLTRRAASEAWLSNAVGRGKDLYPINVNINKDKTADKKDVPVCSDCKMSRLMEINRESMVQEDSRGVTTDWCCKSIFVCVTNWMWSGLSHRMSFFCRLCLQKKKMQKLRLKTYTTTCI